MTNIAVGDLVEILEYPNWNLLGIICHKTVGQVLEVLPERGEIIIAPWTPSLCQRIRYGIDSIIFVMEAA